ncbi:hypothetical protein ARMGADRAFT_1168358 [Armillaria gallica]|uniref:Uncharacterized protein n=1 Tax=Armillaria gallica TaxID=47427 RepID=A0A2H3DI23_ARMGA|nr:hypothetical protein ARMGADRAFT_1168358 [Armillaria gallica]
MFNGTAEHGGGPETRIDGVSQIEIWHDSSSYHQLSISRCAAHAYSSYPSIHGRSACLDNTSKSTGPTVVAAKTTKRRDDTFMSEVEIGLGEQSLGGSLCYAQSAYMGPPRRHNHDAHRALAKTTNVKKVDEPYSDLPKGSTLSSNFRSEVGRTTASSHFWADFCGLLHGMPWTNLVPTVLVQTIIH